MNASFVGRRLHSLLGVVPLGVFLLLHLGTTAAAPNPRETEGDPGGAARLALEVVLVYLPLLFHAAYGIGRLRHASPNLVRYPFAKNWAYTLQRVSGGVGLIFIAGHFYEYRLQTLLSRLHPSDLPTELGARLSTLTAPGIPLLALGYVLGLAAVTFHFANGLSQFCATWGLVTSRRGARRVAWCAGSLGVMAFLVGAHTVVDYATGGPLVGSELFHGP